MERRHRLQSSPDVTNCVRIRYRALGVLSVLRKRRTPPTARSVRELASRRGYLLTRDDQHPRRYKLFYMSGQRAEPIASREGKERFAWRLAEADAWLRKQPLLREL